jgi:hypothetical protein
MKGTKLRSKECDKTAKYADPETKDNQPDSPREQSKHECMQANMAMCAQTRCVQHLCQYLLGKVTAMGFSFPTGLKTSISYPCLFYLLFALTMV